MSASRPEKFGSTDLEVSSFLYSLLSSSHGNRSDRKSFFGNRLRRYWTVKSARFLKVPVFKSIVKYPFRPRLYEQIKHALCAQIRPVLLHTDREFEQLKEVLFAHVNAALG